jgi:hypothetical protein
MENEIKDLSAFWKNYQSKTLIDKLLELIKSRDCLDRASELLFYPEELRDNEWRLFNRNSSIFDLREVENG